MSGIYGPAILAIDPGDTESAIALVEIETRKPLWVDKLPNDTVAAFIRANAAKVQHVVIEMIASYGMPVGREVFETCVWIGRFEQITRDVGARVERIVRKDVKMHLCHSNAAKDSNVIQALIDRFAYGIPNRGKGRKAEPGWFYGFKDDIWQAYALGVLVADREQDW